MQMLFFILGGLCMLGVLVSLGAGLLSMGRNTEAGHRRSQTMMRSRVILQGLALLFLAIAFLMGGGS